MGFRIEVDLMCIILMQWILRRLLKEKEEKRSQRPFLFLVYFLVGTCLADIGIAIVEGRAGTVSFILNTVFNALFLILMVCTCYSWFIYTNTFTRTKKLVTVDNCWGYRIPMFILIILTMFSPWSGIIYLISKDTNLAIAGYLGFLTFLIPCFYIVMSAIQLLIAFVYDPETKTVLSVETIVMFIALPVASLVWNIFFTGSSTTIPAFSLILAAVCFDVQIGHISTDGLTGLNNKRQYLQFIQNCLNEPQGPLKLYLFMIDLDYFKHINDEYGHSEGDNALIEVAELLKRICSGSQGMFLARYGGDEFVFVIKSRFEEEITNLKTDILKAIKERNDRSSKKYKLSVSIGYASYRYGEDTLESLTARADEMLYDEKTRHHIELDKASVKE